MKNYLVGALLICAIPAVAVGQVTVRCETCTHEVSVYMGTGGLIATADTEDDDEMVTWVATCDGVTTSGKLEPNKDGVVGHTFTMENGQACNADGGSFQIGPVLDGGWFWINDADNSAVGSLVAKGLFDDKGEPLGVPVKPTDAGDSVMVTEGKGAVLLKHTNGRVGILPTLLPEAPMEIVDPTKCGFTGSATATDPAKPRNKECMLGDGKTITLATISDGFSGETRTVADKAMITRPRSTGEIEVEIDLWGNGTGHFVTSHDAAVGNGISAMRGQPSVSGTEARALARLTGVTYTVTRGALGVGDGDEVADSENTDLDDDSEADDGLARSAAGGDMVTVTITSDTDYCSKDNDYDATVTVNAIMTDPDSATQITPPVLRATRGTVGLVGSTSFTVVCPASAANLGTELVPDNPFPPTFE